MPIQTPICDFGQKAHDFKLKSTDNKIISLKDIKGENGTLIMFICNHCPYVKAVTKDIVEDCKRLKDIGINSVAICSNDAENYIFFKNNKKYILDLKWLNQNSKEYQNFNKKLLEVTVNMSKNIRFPQNDISLMVTSVIAVSVNLGDQLLERNDLKPSEVSLFATKLFLKGL